MINVTIKELILSLINNLPDDVSFDDIMESIYVQQKITKGIDQLEKGEYILHDDVKEKARKWLK